MVAVEMVEASKADDVWGSSVEVVIVLVVGAGEADNTQRGSVKVITRAGEGDEASVGDVGEELGVTGAGKAVDT